MNSEQLAAALSQLYCPYGYQMYTMSKFEEYDLYLRNRDFLLSDRVLTFTDTDGRLMALKPDVTLSIIKNTEVSEKGIEKVFYRETVYRPGNRGFREIMQIGLECMGQIDSYCIYEVLLLAIKSLKAISDRCVLDISHMGLLSRMLKRYGFADETKQRVLKAISSKNLHELREICQEAGTCVDALEQLVGISGSPSTALPQLQALFPDAPELAQFKKLLDALETVGADCINVDFSVVNNMSYYNGIVFRGFVEGVPTGVLSGGQYDGLMEKMKRKGRAIGFALYPDLLERIFDPSQTNPVDAVLLYSVDADVCDIASAMQKLTGQGLKVSAQPADACSIGCGEVYRLEGNEVKRIETDA